MHQHLDGLPQPPLTEDQGPLASFAIPPRRNVDGRLVGGSVLFGLGWGMAGFCPGPALASLGLGESATYPFVAAMIAGTLLTRWIDPFFRSRSTPLGAQRA